MTTTDTFIKAFETYCATRRYDEVARRLGIGQTTARRWAFKGAVLRGGRLPKRTCTRRDDGLPGASLAAWLEASVDTSALSATEARQLYRWGVEHSSATLWAADRFATAHGLHINDYFDWCEDTGHRAWAGAVPFFETEPLTDHDWAEIARAWPNPDERIAA